MPTQTLYKVSTFSYLVVSVVFCYPRSKVQMLLKEIGGKILYKYASIYMYQLGKHLYSYRILENSLSK